MKNTKKVMPIFLGAFLLVLVACQEGPKKEESTETNGAETQEKVSPPKGIISLEESKSLYDNYTQNRKGLIERYEMERHPEEKFEVARFTAFDYATIKQYIAFIEQEADSAGVNISSLRFYFANYPDTEDFPDGNKIVHPRQNSIFVVPAMKVDDGEYGFYIGADGKAKLIKDAVGETSVGGTAKNGQKSYASFAPSFSRPNAAQEQSLALNRGSSSPPPWSDY